MPELPEVQTIVDDLNRKVRGRKITAVWSDTPKQIHDHTAPSRRLTDKDQTEAEKNLANFKRDIVGEKILGARRRAKNILIDLSGDKTLLIHQKMTGHLLVGKWQIANGKARAIEPRAVVEDPYNRYVHLILMLDDGRMLALSDLRKFAKIILGTRKQIEGLAELASLGPDALDPKLSLQPFARIVQTSGPTIKQVLMNPNKIAGIGNIYSDDILWRAKIHPQQAPAKLSKEELKRLYLAMREILAKAVVLRGTSTSDFRDTSGKEGGYTDYRLVYQREGEPCQRCKTSIKRITVGGRSAHFCSVCQKPERLYRTKMRNF